MLGKWMWDGDRASTGHLSQMGGSKRASARRGRVGQAGEHGDFTQAGGKGMQASSLPASGIAGRAEEKQRGQQCREGNSKDGGRGKTQKCPRQREVLTKPWSFPERSE